MLESKFIRTFRKIHKEYIEVFNALEEYDRTRRLRKITYKERANFTIDAKTLKKFRTYCNEQGYNMSRLLENFMKSKIEHKSLNTYKIKIS
ncbi:hypothetical protein COV16_03880 [Candidatus Woesearchaeota archaeon CG10_big_fil_rev_8_21_14_0_10_34_8]|nr:MAG: hypothetical protein COV16_03880 [Candidatus Woesearchaeota archaeon CG10_big_fil_rev_8_21_14_0_10_34_8]